VLRKCSVCEREFAVGIYGEKDTTVCPECRAIDESKMQKETLHIGELCVRIENVWREYENLQDEYRKLTGRDYMWLR